VHRERASDVPAQAATFASRGATTRSKSADLARLGELSATTSVGVHAVAQLAERAPRWTRRVQGSLKETRRFRRGACPLHGAGAEVDRASGGSPPLAMAAKSVRWGRLSKKPLRESKIKGGGILRSLCASSGIRRSIQAAAEGSSANRRGGRQRRCAPDSTPTASWLPVPTACSVGVRRVPDSVSYARNLRRRTCSRAALPMERGGARPVVDRRHTLLRAVQSIGQEGIRFGRISTPTLQIRCKGPVRPRSDSLPVAVQEQASRAVGHSGPHESRWAKDSSMIPVDSRRMARLYLAFASFRWAHLLRRPRGHTGHRPLPCRCSAHQLVLTDAFDLPRRVVPRRRSRCPCSGLATISRRARLASASAVPLTPEVVERSRRGRNHGRCERAPASGR
jgi:hypothetical protein